MTVLSQKPLTLAEVKELATNLEEKKQLADYLKKFTKLSKEKSGKLAEEIRALDNPKIKEENIVKIIDFLPEDSEALNKIFTEVTLTEQEANAVLELVKKY